MPRHDFSPRPPRRDAGGRSFTPGFAYLAIAEAMRRGRRRKGPTGKDLDEGGVPVEPNRPKGLSGGAAAALDFED